MRTAPSAAPRSRRARARVLALAFGVASALVAATSASAGPAAGALDRPEGGWMRVIPGECRRHMALPAGPRDERVEWEHGLSFAACLQDAPSRPVDDPAQLEALVGELSDRLELSMLIYLQALAEGPPPIQLRAAYHMGLLHVALITRARGALASPPPGADPAAADHTRQLRATLEPLLARSRRAAWVSFMAIHEAARRDPLPPSDEVGRNMIREARAQLVGLRDATEVLAR